MYAAKLILLTASFFPQQSSEQTIPLILGPEPTRIRIVTESEARQRYERLLKIKQPTEYQRRLLAALTISLGSIPNRCTEGQKYAQLCL